MDKNTQFNEIYSEYKKFVWNLTSKYFQDKWKREEAFQEIFVRVYRYLDKVHFKEAPQLKQWLYRISISTLINLFKKFKRKGVLEDVLLFNSVLFAHKNSNKIDRVESEEAVENILKPLNARQRAIFLLREEQGLSYEEIAELVDISIGTVRSSLNRSKAKIKKYLKKEGNAYEGIIRIRAGSKETAG